MKLCARIVLFAYALLMFKPVVPILSDRIAHTFWAHVHVATVHKHNGEQHVHYELKKLDKDDDSNKAAHSVKWATEQTLHLAPATIQLSRQLMESAGRKKYPAYTCLFRESWGSRDYPPPKGMVS